MLIHLHGHATTTPKIQAEIQASENPAWVLADRFGTTEQTVWKWRKRNVWRVQNTAVLPSSM
ncbi:MAG: hypothetical protein JKY94_00365 [Rhodobacteraceae bacterium]|nr:hypothetical protein [Paracoccaceae bacterium]